MSVFITFGARVSRFSTPAFGWTAPFRSRAVQSQQLHLYKLGKAVPHIRSPVWRQVVRSYNQKPKSHTQPNPTPNLNSPEPHSLSARLKKLSREYGWTVIGVYLALTVADFPFCFLAVKYIGAERVAYAEHVIVGGAKTIIQKVFPDMFQEDLEERANTEAAEASETATEAERKNASKFVPSTSGPFALMVPIDFWTQVALAFVIHKSFIFIRVPLTAAITPKVVKTLRGWGYDIGKRKPKSK
jgi:hypothetical protein